MNYLPVHTYTVSTFAVAVRYLSNSVEALLFAARLEKLICFGLRLSIPYASSICFFFCSSPAASHQGRAGARVARCLKLRRSGLKPPPKSPSPPPSLPYFEPPPLACFLFELHLKYSILPRCILFRFRRVFFPCLVVSLS